MRRPVSCQYLIILLAMWVSPAAAGPAPVPVPPVTPRLLERSLPLFQSHPTVVRQHRLAGEKAPATLNAVVLLCEFEDFVFYGREDAGAPVDSVFMEIHYAARDSVYFDHHLRDVREYYHSASGDGFDLQFTIHAAVVILPHAMGWYGNHPTEGEQPVILARDVVAAVDAEVDFSGFDTVFLIHAGPGEETDVAGDSPEQIYSTYLDPESFAEAAVDSIIDDPWLEADNGATRIDQVLVLPETAFQDDAKFGSLGIYCFEVGQRLGMLPLGLGNRSWGIGSTGLMGWGLYAASGWNPPHPCAYNKLLMGWIDPVVVIPDGPVELGLTPAMNPALPSSCVRIEAGGGEYWLLEYRLQDPDGNGHWNIDPVLGDLNGNGRRDYWDDSTIDGVPETGGKFDPDTDQREWLIGAEWDFHMTFNGDRPEEEDTGRGSGVYIWHVDEDVIHAALAAGTRLVNWDPARKGVDLEEADGIQDMDSRQADLAYGFGHEDDVFRGDQAVFGPATRPNSSTNGDAATGVLVDGFSDVVDGASAEQVDYVDEMTFVVSRTASVTGPVLAAERELPPDTDLRGSHVLLVDLDQIPGGTAEIVLAGQAGEVFVLDGDLNEYLDHDSDPATLAPFVVGTWADEPVAWNQPSAVGDLDGDGDLDIVLTGPRGLYAFQLDGTPLRGVLLPDAHGLYVELGDCAVPPVLVPPDPTAVPDLTGPMRAAVVVRGGSATWLRLYGGLDADVFLDINLGEVSVRAPPILAFGRLWIAAADTFGGNHRLLACALDPAAGEPILMYELEREPGSLVPAWGYEAGTTGDRGSWVTVFSVDGHGETVRLDNELERSGADRLWPDTTVARSALAAGSLVGDGWFGSFGPLGDWEDGWPQRPIPGFAVSDTMVPAGPLAAQLAGNVRVRTQFIFPAPDGRLFAYGPRGEAEAGWPLAGPSATAGTPALGQLTGDLQDDLVAIGTFARIRSVDADSGELETTLRSVVAIWSDVAVPGGVWTMWGGSPLRNGFWDAEAAAPPVVGASGSGIISGSHICYPSPMTGSTLYVRARLRSNGRVRSHVYNLEGELVASSVWREVSAQSAFDLPVELPRTVSGMYLCRLEAVTDDGANDTSVVSFAISR